MLDILDSAGQEEFSALREEVRIRTNNGKNVKLPVRNYEFLPDFVFLLLGDRFEIMYKKEKENINITIIEVKGKLIQDWVLKKKNCRTVM